ncbi:hypothetical protein GCK32_021229 [Trichostrongylus colubriformis]|uniref:Uncharacterized protein n=1 Tax=Trichostrongylus colubriformis TaxID=6319 RepID=A0AAN8FTD6_TRICO
MVGKRILVTGASSGIGLSLTEQLCKDGHHVTITVRDQEKADSTRQLLAEKQVILHLVKIKCSRPMKWAIRPDHNSFTSAACFQK